MELMSQKLPPTFHPQPEDHNDAEDVTSPRPYSPDDIYIPPSGMHAHGGYSSGQSQLDLQLEDTLYPSSGMPATSGIQGTTPRQPDDDALLPSQHSRDNFARQPATGTTFRPTPSTSLLFKPTSRATPTPGLLHRHDPGQPFQQPGQDQLHSRLDRRDQSHIQPPRSPNWMGLNQRRPWREPPDRQATMPWADQENATQDFFTYPRDRVRQPRSWQKAYHGDLHHDRGFHVPTPMQLGYNMPVQPRSDEPRPSFPIFNGRSGEWDAFWIQFELLSKRYQWRGEKLVEQLLLSLRGEAMTFAASLSPDIRYDELFLICALKERFSHSAPAETHQANLSHIRKSSKESLQEYASRVRTLMSKAYPEIIHTATYEQLLIQNFMNGLPDQTLAYEVLVQQPRTLHEAINLVDWHECCKQTARRRSDLRHVKTDLHEKTYCSDDDTDPDMRRLNNRTFITEERLQQVLRDLKKNLGSRNHEKDKNDQQNRPPRNVTCYTCGKEGHISPRCPTKKTPEQSENYDGLKLQAESQPRC